MSHAEAPAEIAPGTLLGAYQLEAKIGAGGMGQVWRARDTRLDRMVAVKVLPPQLAVRADFQERFQREAKALSALKHLNICLLYDIGEDKGVRYLVMELLEGSPPRGPMPAAALRRCASEIASALDAAHRAGLIHRDLKPGNVLVTATGAKLLDFGLAKSIQPSDSDPDATKTEGLTQEGAIMGTFSYMAPEQVEGRAAGPRADIWAFGAVLYELATGRKAFEGATQAAIVGNILHSEPPPADIPPGLDRIIRRCLQKDPEERWQTARDLVIELRDMDKAPPPPPEPVGKSARSWQMATALSVLAAAALAALHWGRGETSPTPLRMRFEVTPPAGHRFRGAQRPGISPDGTKLAFVAHEDKTSTDRLWIRPLDSTESFPLPGTEGALASGFAWSPDSDAVAYSTTGSLLRVSISGGRPTRLCACALEAMEWSRDGVIYAVGDTGPVQAVPAAGGQPKPVTKLDAARGEIGHRGFTLSPDQRHFVYRTTPPDGSALYLGSFDGSPPKRIALPGVQTTAYWYQGYLMFNQGPALVAQKLNPDRGSLEGPLLQLAEDVQARSVSTSDNGVLAMLPRSLVGRNLVLSDRTGARQDTLAPSSGTWDHPEFSPDGKRLAVQRTTRGERVSSEIWTIDLARKVSAQVSFGPRATAPAWSSDGSMLYYSTDPQAQTFRTRSDGSGTTETLPASRAHHVHESPDGKWLAYQVYPNPTQIWLLRLDGQSKAAPLFDMPTDNPQFSPDGRWIAYTSSATGRSEVYVQSFPPGHGKWTVSRDGGTLARWRGDGKELFYSGPDGAILSVAVKQRNGLEFGAPVRLFDAGLGGSDRFAVSPDGQRFVYPGQPTERAIIVVSNWLASVKR